VQEAAAKVQSWLDRQQQATQPQRVDAFDKFARTVRSDSPPVMPSWKEARPELPVGRWRNPRGAA
jgi:hypothetical protein